MKFPVFAAALAAALFGVQPAVSQVPGKWTSVGAMSSPRFIGIQASLANGEALVAGGNSNSSILATAEIFSPATNAWRLTGSMAKAREAFAAVTLANGRVLVMGGVGLGVGGRAVVLGSAELYDPATRKWTAAGSLAVPRFRHTATLLNDGKVLVASGCDFDSSCITKTSTSEIYDPATNRWSLSGSMIATEGRANFTSVRLKDGRVLAIGGNTFVGDLKSEIYNPATRIWSPVPNLRMPRAQNSASLLPSGKVLVVGGLGTDFPLQLAVLYNPVTNTWRPTGGMKTGRYGHTSTTLLNGSVIIGGGVTYIAATNQFVPVNSSEIYSEATGTFKPAAPIAFPRLNQTATLLKSGRVLASGGYGPTLFCCAVGNAEVYTPLP